MTTKLTAEQVQAYRRDGVLIYRSFLSGGEVDRMLADIAEAIGRMGDDVVAGNSAYGKVPADTGGDYYGRVFLQRVNMWKVSEAIRRTFVGPELGEMLCRLEGIDGIRVWHDQTLQKRPWANPTSWHLDNPNWSFHSPHAISIWIALDDATIENGCMCYLPGTHRLARYDRKGGFGPDVGALFREYPEWATLTPVYGTMKKGDCGFHNGLTAHGAGPNMTPGWRRAMTCAYMPEGATFNGIQNILPEGYFKGLAVGDVLDDDALNPLAWKR